MASNQQEKIKNVSLENSGYDITERVETILSFLNKGLYGKEEAVKLALLSAIAGKSVFFLGPPGTAKSMISRRITHAFKDFYDDDGKLTTDNGKYFEYLMNEFSTPDEICGPVDLSALNEKPSRYVRLTGGYLPDSNVAFLDEIWKSGPAILNTLLTIINEKKFHNGNEVKTVPLLSLTAASNELPEKNRGLEALWDRFILRLIVNPVDNENDFFKLCNGVDEEVTISEQQKQNLLTIDEVLNWQNEISKVVLSDVAENIITTIRKMLELKNQEESREPDELYYVSDRRWKNIIHILKTSAFINGRTEVDIMDCSLIKHAIWNTEKQCNEVETIIKTIIQENSISIESSVEDIMEQIDEFDEYVMEQFFEEGPERPKMYSDNNGSFGKIFYKLCNKQTVYNNSNVLFIGQVNDKLYFLDKNGNYISSEYGKLEVYGNQIMLRQGSSSALYILSNYYNSSNLMPLEMERSGFQKNKTIFETLDLYELRSKKADNEKYTPINSQIEERLKTIEDFKNTEGATLKNNLFGDEEYLDLIFFSLEKQKEMLEDVSIKLSQVKHKYSK